MRIERQAARWLARLHADRCDEQERARFRIWLGADARHATVFEALTSVWELVGATSPESARRPIVLSRRRLLLSGGAALTAAAGGFVAVGAGAENYHTGVGERRSIVLADRSKVLLDAESHLRVRTRDSGCEATLKRGRAHFDLDSRSFGALLIHVGTCDLRIDRGSFEVERVATETARIFMLSGAAEVRVDAGGGQRAMRLATGQLFDESSTTVVPVDAEAAERSSAWRDGRAIFSNDSLAQAVAIMNRYDRRRLLLADDRTGKLRISGTFRLGDNAAFADALQTMLPIDVAVASESLSLSSRIRRDPS
jgi:transmembrane sensor